MKKKLLLSAFTIASLLYASAVHGISHPLAKDYYSNNRLRITADSVAYREYDENGNPVEAGYDRYVRSKDGLRDTVFSQSCCVAYVRVYEYASDGKWLAMREFVPSENRDRIEWTVLGETRYEYDSHGRLAAESFNFDGNVLMSKTYTYTDNSRTMYEHEINSTVVETYDINYTDSGYFSKKTVVTTPASGQSETKTSETEYVFDSQDRLIRAGDVHYIYTDDGGYTVISPYGKVYYLENGYPFLTEDNPGSHTEFEYYSYGADGNVSASTLLSADGQPSVYGIKGFVIVEPGGAATSARIYSIGGQLVKEVAPTASAAHVALPAGFYIVKTADASHRVFVR